MKTNQKNPKEIEIMILHAYLFIFLPNFWVYHFFHLCDVFHGSGSFQWIQTDVFSCPGDPGTIPDCDRFGKSHFLMKIFKILNHMMRWSSLKTHMYIHNLVNLRVRRPPATQNGQRFCESSNSTERMLRKTKIKIEKGSKSGAEDISKIQHPR